MEKIALLPGGFKPPHAGHYNAAKWLAANTDADTVVVRIGAKERGGITREVSLNVGVLLRGADEATVNKINFILKDLLDRNVIQNIYSNYGIEYVAPK